MNLSLSNMLSSSASGLDPDAKGYIDAVVTAGATVSATQKKAINTFVKTGKADGWYSSLKRLYLPIWASAAPNAICMTSLTSGTFNGTVTHAAGYVQGDGSTGYFDFGVSPSSLGLTANTAHIIALLKTTPASDSNRTIIGVRQSSGQDFRLLANTSTSFSGLIMASGVDSVSSSQVPIGIVSVQRFGGVSYNAKRVQALRSQLNPVTKASVGSAPTQNIFALARNDSGAAGFTAAQIGAYSVGLGLSDTQDNAFTLAIKNLWETCTSLSLP